MIPLHDDNPTQHPPVVTVGLIVVCVLVFLWQVSLSYPAQIRLVQGLGFIPAVLFTDLQRAQEIDMVPGVVTVFTSMFLHGGFLHLIGNMLFLWIFGNNVEDAMGHVRFLVFYLVCGVAAAVAQAAFDPVSQVPMIGASGALSGVLGAYFLLHPRAKVLVLVPVGFYLLRIPAAILLGGWLLIQIVSALSSVADGGGGVAWLAHIGGFLGGLVLVSAFKRADVRLWQ